MSLLHFRWKPLGDIEFDCQVTIPSTLADWEREALEQILIDLDRRLSLPQSPDNVNASDVQPGEKLNISNSRNGHASYSPEEARAVWEGMPALSSEDG